MPARSPRLKQLAETARQRASYERALLLPEADEDDELTWASLLDVDRIRDDTPRSGATRKDGPAT